MAPRSGRTSGLSSTRAKRTQAAPDPTLVGRLADDLDRLIPAGTRLGVAVSGGPDSLALLLLAAAARPGRIEAATVDHGLRPDSASEAEMVAALCRSLEVPHSILTVRWKRKPVTALQERARIERYRLLGRWAEERGLPSIATAHHLDDQAETLLMRLTRGAGVQGLAGMRPVAAFPEPGSSLRLVRPLLGWRRQELVELCRHAGVKPAEDPSNADPRFERVRVRRGLAKADWLDPGGIARSAANLAAAEAAIRWAVDREWEAQVTGSGREIVYRPSAPAEIRREIAVRAINALAREGQGNVLRGREIDRLLVLLSKGGKATLRGVLCRGGEEWRFSAAPSRRH
jgi:tRNA(Ile)-lysidine synthase